MDMLPADAPAPRLCHLIKWPDFDGYGFNLHGEKSKPGQYIGKVDKDSPAELAGLKANDKIIEVNGTNISNENHKQVVQRIKATANETKLLVLDAEAEQYYNAKGMVVKESMPNVIHSITPVPRPMTTNNAPPPLIRGNVSENGTANSDVDNVSHVSDSGSASSLPSKSSPHSWDDEQASSPGPSPTPPGSSPSMTPPPFINTKPMMNRSTNNALNLNMTAQEMRAMLAARKKEKLDPKTQKMDLRKKYDIIQTL